MGLLKPITISTGNTMAYHKLGAFSFDDNRALHITVPAYRDKKMRDANGAPWPEHVTVAASDAASIFEVIAPMVYAMLKEHGYEDAEDVIEVTEAESIETKLDSDTSEV
jgi:hypothetical protein